MTTNLTGTDLIFSTTWTLKGEPYNPYSKLIHHRAGQLRTLRSALPESDPATGCMTNRPVLEQPEMSMDGTRYSYTASWTGNDACLDGSTVGEVRSDTGELIHSENGSVRMSANGRWALFRNRNSYTLTNLETGFREAFNYVDPYNLPIRARAVANDGTVALAQASFGVFIKRPGLASETWPAPVSIESATLADSGNFAALMARPLASAGSKPQIWIADFGSRQFVQAVATEEDYCGWPSMSTDGSRMAFISTANWLTTNNSRTTQAFIMDLNTGRLTQLTTGTDDVYPVVLSGDGRAAFARHEDGSIVYIDVETGLEQEIVPPIPQLMVMAFRAVAGSRQLLNVPASRRPVVTIDGAAVHLLKTSGSQVEFVLPQGLAVGAHEMEVSYEGSPFQPFKIEITVKDFEPQFRYWGSIPQIWHDSDGTAVYGASPARSGEVVEVLLSGLGAVDAEGNTQMGMSWEVYCPDQNQGASIEVLSSRMSPYEGEEGLYRVKFRLPQISLAGNAALRCTDARDESVTTSAYFAAAP
jgi:uncharacterized protein (TIGR03437 family)